MQSSSLPVSKDTSSDLLNKKDTPLNVEQAYVIMLAQRVVGNIFAELPAEIVHHICTVANPNPRLKKALYHAAFGELDDLKAMLEEAKQESEESLKLLLLPTETTGTPFGVTAKNTTLLECATLAGDPEMVAMIKPYFSQVTDESKKEMEHAMERQLARCKRCIDAMKTQKPEDLTDLFNVIKAASAQDVAEELKTGKQYDKKYQSDLRNALNNWRQAKLDSSNREIDVLRKPRMFCNYQNWIHVNEYLNIEWDQNKWRNLIVNGDNYAKIYLILRQLRGFIELIELPALERFAFANGEVDPPAAQITRSPNYKYSAGSFPHFDRSSIDSHSGLGFDSYISIYGGWTPPVGRPGKAGKVFKTYVEQKLQTCRAYAATTTSNSNSELVCNRLK
jgi:hypothetical protein